MINYDDQSLKQITMDHYDRSLTKLMKLFAAQYLMWNCAPFLVAVGSFATYVLVDPENNVLDSRFGQLLSPR